MQLWQWRQQQRQHYPHLASQLDALLREACAWSPLDDLCQRHPPACDLAHLDHLWQRHCQEGIPIPYLLGRVTWRGMGLRVSPAVLIPRPETELLVDLALDWLGSQKSQGPWVDLGTGSGALALGLAQRVQQVYAVDISPAALAIAQHNIHTHQLAQRIQCRLGHWFAPLADLQGSLQGMVANPPYIPTGALGDLEVSVRDYEPHLALDGGEDGLVAIRELIQAAPHYLQPGGFWAVEVMAGQAGTVAHLLQESGHYQQITITPDLAGIPRFVSAVTCS